MPHGLKQNAKIFGSISGVEVINSEPSANLFSWESTKA